MQDKKTSRLNRNKTEDISSMIYSKIPPQARELEEAVIGALLIDKDAYTQIIGILQPETFYFDAHSIIFNSIQLIINNS